MNKDVFVERIENQKLKRTVYKKHQLISSHTARRTGATNMYLAGIPIFNIMLITGHKSVKTFLEYIRITLEENALILSNHPFFATLPEELKPTLCHEKQTADMLILQKNNAVLYLCNITHNTNTQFLPMLFKEPSHSLFLR